MNLRALRFFVTFLAKRQRRLFLSYSMSPAGGRADIGSSVQRPGSIGPSTYGRPLALPLDADLFH